MSGLISLAWKLLLFYILYKVIFDFIIPIYRTTKTMKGKMNEMQEKMKEQNQRHTTTATKEPPPPKASNSDYIDYEEVK